MMRLESRISCLLLVFVACGCTTPRNPFSKSQDWASHSDREIERRIASGEYDDAIGRRVGQIRPDSVASNRDSQNRADAVRAPKKRRGWLDFGSDDEELDQVSFEQQLPGTSPDEINLMIEKLVAYEPVALRPQKRELYRQMSPATLRQILAGYERAEVIGQTRIGTQDLANARDRAAASGGHNSIQNAGFNAPNPRRVAENQPLGISDPWRNGGTQQRGNGQLGQLGPGNNLNNPLNGQLNNPNGTPLNNPSGTPQPGGARLQPAGGFQGPSQNGGNITQISGTLDQLGPLNDVGGFPGANSQAPTGGNQQAPLFDPPGSNPIGSQRQQQQPTGSLLPQINPAGSTSDSGAFRPGFGRRFDEKAGSSTDSAGQTGIQLLTPQNVDTQSNLQNVGGQQTGLRNAGPLNLQAFPNNPGQASTRNFTTPGNNLGAPTDQLNPLVPGNANRLSPAGNANRLSTDGLAVDQLANKPPIGAGADTGFQLGSQNGIGGGSGTTTQPTGTQPSQEEATNPANSGLPGRLSNRVQNILPNIRSVAERTLPTLPGIGLGGPPSDTARASTAQQQPSADGLTTAIRLLEQQLAATAPGQSEQERLDYIRKHVGLRTLYLVAGQNEQALVSIPNVKPSEQEFWQQMLWSVASYFDTQGVPNSADRAAQTIGQLQSAVQQLRSSANLKLNNVAFCYKIDGFGLYNRYKQDRFKPSQPILLYAELKNFASQLVEGDRFRTVVQSEIQIYNAAGQQELIGSIPFDLTEDLCRTQREDYFLAYEFSVPERLQPGNYVLVLKVQDQLSRKTTMSRLNFLVVE